MHEAPSTTGGSRDRIALILELIDRALADTKEAAPKRWLTPTPAA